MQAPCCPVRTCCGRPSARQGFFSFARGAWPLVRVTRYPPRLLLSAVGPASHAASNGVIWPKDGWASIACAATAAERLFSPGLRPFLAQAKKVSPPPSSAVLRPEDGCVVDRLWPADRHRGRDGRRLRTARRRDMASIGTFKKSGHEFQGE